MPPRPVVSHDHSEWLLEADRESQLTVLLRKGNTREQVVEALGSPRKKEKYREDHEVEILHFRRTIVGPIVQRTIKAGGGYVRITEDTLYQDNIEVFFKNGILTNVYVTRELEEEFRGYHNRWRAAIEDLREAEAPRT